MRNIIILLSIITLSACDANKNNKDVNSMLTADINNSIVDGFFDGDSTKVTKDTYLIK